MEGSHFPPKKSHMGVPIGNSVPGLRPGPALPTIIIPHPGALVKCFLNGKIKNPTRVLILVGVLVLVATFPHGIEVVALCVGVRHFAQARLSRFVFVVGTIPRVDRAMKMLFTSQGGYTPSPAIIARNSPKASMQAIPISISCFSP